MVSEIFNNVSRWVNVIIIISAFVVYGFNFNDYNERSFSCAAYYGIYQETARNIPLYYWEENNQCCHYTLNEQQNIIQQCE